MASPCGRIMGGMTANLERVTRAARAHRRATNALERARIELAEAIVEATANNAKQSDLTRITGYARETIRRIVKSAVDTMTDGRDPFA
jgi:hypothetical protein